ncbi:MAG TPA: CusA/CzcA family heavy metal efflux RND transporter [Caulobacteraceae bacterium]|jgi:cobalt-zinc-cadmium resistance protein CzcA
MNRIVAFALRHRALTVLLLVVLLFAGGAAFARLNIEAYPDPVPPMVEVVTQLPGFSAEEIERNVSIPVEVQMSGVPHVTSVRSVSLFGLSDVKIQFTYDFTHEEAQQQVINRLAQLSGLPGGAQPAVSPTSPIGEIYRYRVVGPPGYSLTDLKTLQDWVLQRRFKAVPGVIDVTGWGGKTKTYDVVVDNERLLAHGLSLQAVLDALNKSNLNVGGQTVDFGPQSAIVRGVGLIQTPEQVGQVMISPNHGQPVFVRDVAEVKVGFRPRLGIAGQDDSDDIVQGIVLMHRGEKSMPTIRAVQAEVKRINDSGILPLGVRIERIYDRSDLIALTTGTVLHNLVFGVVLIFLVQWAFLGNLRSALIVSATIPFALCFAVLIMTIRGESANLLSVGALDFGLIVDATVIMMENIYRRLAEHRHGEARRGSKTTTILGAAGEVNQAIFFAAAIIIASFIPLFTLTGVEGHIFGPMAKTYAYAILGGLIATFTVTPALSSLLLPDQVSEEETWVVRQLRRVYAPAARFAHDRRALVLGGATALGVVALILARTLGMEFLPHLEEGNFWIRATMPASISLAEGNGYVNRMRRVIKSFPEVVTVVSQHGRPDDGTDATGFFNAEFFTPLKPQSQWPHGLTKDKLTQQINAALQSQFPGVDFNFSQYIQDNVEEAASGVKGENSVKLFGPDLRLLEQTAGRIEAQMAKTPGITDLGVFRSLGQPTVRIDVDRERAAVYGLTPGDINGVVQAAIGGEDAGALYPAASDRNFPIVVRLRPDERGDLDAIRRITVQGASPKGDPIQVPLSEVASVRLTSGAAFVYREQQERYIPIKFSVRDRDLAGAVAEAQGRVARNVRLPPGYHIEWAGELGNLQDAIGRLEVVVPISLGLILLLLYMNFGSARDMLLAASVMPMAMVGGILGLRLTGTPFSISAAIGFVALFGISVMDGIIVLNAFNRLIDEGIERSRGLAQACTDCLRPVVMTCVAACMGLLPAALSNGIGSQVQKPLAIVVVSGMLLAPVLILIVLPVLVDLFSRHAGVEEAEA